MPGQGHLRWAPGTARRGVCGEDAEEVSRMEMGLNLKIVGIMISKTNNNGLYWEYHWDNNIEHWYLVAHPTTRKWVITPVISGLTLQKSQL